MALAMATNNARTDLIETFSPSLDFPVLPIFKTHISLINIRYLVEIDSNLVSLHLENVFQKLSSTSILESPETTSSMFSRDDTRSIHKSFFDFVTTILSRSISFYAGNTRFFPSPDYISIYENKPLLAQHSFWKGDVDLCETLQCSSLRGQNDLIPMKYYDTRRGNPYLDFLLIYLTTLVAIKF